MRNYVSSKTYVFGKSIDEKENCIYKTGKEKTKNEKQ